MNEKAKLITKVVLVVVLIALLITSIVTISMGTKNKKIVSSANDEVAKMVKVVTDYAKANEDGVISQEALVDAINIKVKKLTYVRSMTIKGQDITFTFVNSVKDMEGLDTVIHVDAKEIEIVSLDAKYVSNGGKNWVVDNK